MMRDIFAELLTPEVMQNFSHEQIAPLILQLASIQSTLAAKLLDPSLRTQSQSAEPDALLTAEQAAQQLSVTPHWLYRHWKQLPFSRRLSRKTLRFSENGIRKWQGAKKT
jgi:predicted DNA-binding transcriptional regulator AlpA